MVESKNTSSTAKSGPKPGPKSTTAKTTTRTRTRKTATTAAKSGTKVTNAKAKAPQSKAKVHSVKTASRAASAAKPAVTKPADTPLAEVQPSPSKPPAGMKKKAPTPKRKDQEKKNLNPIVKVNAPKRKMSKEERAEQKSVNRSKYADIREKEAQAFRTGDQKYLPERDKGEIKKFIRNLVDAKRSPAEFFLPIAVVVLILSSVLNQVNPMFAFTLTILIYLYILATIVFLFVKIRGIKQQVVEKFGEKKAKNERGISSYALNRMTQPRFARLPKVGV
ncbi:MAG: DUF3043 domain-containing protein [Candidatus Ancillula sp.]|jgi:hypothetical protein|nr:DUF3043 domain-containing protein [Candidatus Ancillula sp.]